MPDPQVKTDRRTVEAATRERSAIGSGKANFSLRIARGYNRLQAFYSFISESHTQSICCEYGKEERTQWNVFPFFSRVLTRAGVWKVWNEGSGFAARSRWQRKDCWGEWIQELSTVPDNHHRL